MSTVTSLRSRMKDVVRKEIQEAAYALFAERGFDVVSVEEISVAAGVSQRTFFRYFPAKEDVALQWLDDTGPLIRDALRQQPIDLPIFDALRAAFVGMVVTNSEVAEHSAFVQGLSHESNKLQAGLLLREQSWIADLSVVIAERLGTEPSDLAPQVWAGIAMSIGRAVGEWGHRNSSADVANLMIEGFAVPLGEFAQPPLISPTGDDAAD